MFMLELDNDFKIEAPEAALMLIFNPPAEGNVGLIKLDGGLAKHLNDGTMCELQPLCESALDGANQVRHYVEMKVNV